MNYIQAVAAVQCFSLLLFLGSRSIGFRKLNAVCSHFNFPAVSNSGWAHKAGATLCPLPVDPELMVIE